MTTRNYFAAADAKACRENCSRRREGACRENCSRRREEADSLSPGKSGAKDARTPNAPRGPGVFCFFASALLAGLHSAAAQTTNVLNPTNALHLSPPLADVGASLGRVMLALALVLGIFLGGVWLFRNWQRLTLHRGQSPKLNVLEARSLGGRHALYVVGYDQERFLVAASPTGINLLSHLPQAEEGAISTAPLPPSFAHALVQKLKGK